MHKGIDTIIFDLGGVLLDIDFGKTTRAFSLLGLQNHQSSFSKYEQAELFRSFETGSLSEDEFLSHLIAEAGEYSKHVLENAWCALLGEVPPERYKLLEKLSHSHRLFILSNTNTIHARHFENIIDRSYGWDKFQKLFDTIYYSHKIGIRKPDVAIYKYVIEKNNILPEKTLFIDDTESNLESAKMLGIVTMHVGDNDDVTHLLKGL